MNMASNRVVFMLLFTAIVIIFLTGCAANERVEFCLTGHEYGFLGGLWHGFTAPFGFIGMLFDKNIAMYAPNNNGGFYALGFLLGSGGWGFCGGKRAHNVKVFRSNYRQSDNFDRAEIVE